MRLSGALEHPPISHLIMEGYLKRTPQGRVATELSYKKLGLKSSSGSQAKLF